MEEIGGGGEQARQECGGEEISTTMASRDQDAAREIPASFPQRLSPTEKPGSDNVRQVNWWDLKKRRTERQFEVDSIPSLQT